MIQNFINCNNLSAEICFAVASGPTVLMIAFNPMITNNEV